MLAVFIGSIVVFWHILFGVIGPGLLLNRLFQRFHSKSQDLTAPITRIIGYGSILMVVELLVLQIAINSFYLPTFPIVIAKVLIDILLAAWLFFGIRRGEFKTWLSRLKQSVSTFDFALFAVALVYGICGTVFFPYGHDNSAIKWTAQFLLDPQCSIASSEGAPAYIGILVFPSLILQGTVPVPTLAAGLKIPLAFLVAFVFRRFMNQLPLGIHRSTAAFISMLFLFCVFFSHYGLLATGKETVFSITLFFLFIAELIHRGAKDSTANNVQASLALAASVGFGAVSIPYALLLFFTLICMQWAGGHGKPFKPFRFTSTLIFITAIPIIVSVHAMLNKPWWLVVTLVSVPFLVSYSLKNVAIPLLPISSKIKKLVPAFSLLVILGFLFCLMPVNYFLGYFPMDGESTIIQVIDFNGTIGWLGIIGLVIFFFAQYSRTNLASSAFAMFPFVGLLLPLILARFPDAEIGVAKLKIWDLAKDIANWILGFYSSIFASYFAIVAARHFAILRVKNASVPAASVSRESTSAAPIIAKRILFVTTCLVAIYSSSKTIKRLNIPTYNNFGGHHDPIFAGYIKLCYEKRFDKNEKVDFGRVWISNEAAFIQHRYTVAMYGINAKAGDFEQFKQTLLQEDQARIVVLAQDEWNKFASEQNEQANQFQMILENERDVIIFRNVDD